MKIQKISLRATLACYALSLLCSPVIAQTPIYLENPSFETNAAGIPFATGFSGGYQVPGNEVAGWLNSDNTVGYGSTIGVAGENGLTTEDGNACVLTSDTYGAYQITGYQMQAGKILVLNWWGKQTCCGGSQVVELLGAVNNADAFNALTPLATATGLLNPTGLGGSYTKYTLAHVVQSADVGKYAAVFFASGGGTSAFDNFGLTVQTDTHVPILAAPLVTPSTCYARSPVSLSDIDMGTGAHTTYRWQTNSDLSGGLAGIWADIPGATSTNVSFTPPNSHPGGANYTLNFQVIASSDAGSVTSAPAALVVMPASAPVITMNTTPSSATVSVGDAVSFNAAFVGTEPIAYQWQTDVGQPGIFTNIPGEISTMLVVATNGPVSGYYRLAASNVVGITTSTSAKLTVWYIYSYGTNLLVNPYFMYDANGNLLPNDNGGNYNQGFDLSATTTNDVAGWLNTGTIYTDSGFANVGNGTVGVPNVSTNDGGYFAYLFTADGDGAYQITSHKMHAGDQLTLTWWAQGLYGAVDGLEGQHIELLSATNMTDVYSNLTVLAINTDPLVYTNNGCACPGIPYSQYKINYMASASDEGKYVAVSFNNDHTLSADNFTAYVAYADFSLKVADSSRIISISQDHSSGQIQLNWGNGVLMQATNIAGPWVANYTAQPPYNITNASPQKFYGLFKP